MPWQWIDKLAKYLKNSGCLLNVRPRKRRKVPNYIQWYESGVMQWTSGIASYLYWKKLDYTPIHIFIHLARGWYIVLSVIYVVCIRSDLSDLSIRFVRFVYQTFIRFVYQIYQICLSDLLWTSPELLADKNHHKTKEADVYGFGIIMHEVFYRMGPFAGMDYLTPKGMVVAKSLNILSTKQDLGRQWRPRKP